MFMKNVSSTKIDFSNYPKDLKFFDQAYKKVIGKMKDESKRKIINDFVGLMSKDVFHEKY